MTTRQRTAVFGLSGFGLFVLTLLMFSILNAQFDPFEDYISQLGALGQPHALWWNLIGFLAVGLLLVGFGIGYGTILADRTVGVLLALFGLGLAATAIPVDMTNETAPVSKAHVVAICLGLAAWLFALARMAHQSAFPKPVRFSANVAAALLVSPMIGQVLGWWAMPVTHRLVFAVVFGWVAYTSLGLIRPPAIPSDTQGRTV